MEKGQHTDIFCGKSVVFAWEGCEKGLCGCMMTLICCVPYKSRLSSLPERSIPMPTIPHDADKRGYLLEDFSLFHLK